MPTDCPVDREHDDTRRRRGRDHRPHPGPRGDLRRRELAGHAPAAPLGAGAADDRLERRVHLDDLLDQRRLGVEARIRGEDSLGVGEQHQNVGADEVRHERGEAVVVAVADLVVGDGVVLVHDRDHAEVEEPLQGLARVEVLGAVPEVIGREQHLAGDQPVLAEQRAELPHQQGLTDGGERLQRADVGRARLEAERR